MSKLEQWLISLGCSETLYPSSIGRKRSTADWDPAGIWNGVDVQGTFFKRYGFFNVGVAGDTVPTDSNLYSAGNYAAENMAGSGGGVSDALIRALRSILGDPSYLPSPQDLMDLRFVKDPKADDLVFNTQVVPKFREEKAKDEPAGPAGGAMGGEALTAGVARLETAVTTLEDAVGKLAASNPAAPDSDPRVAAALARTAAAIKATTGGGKPIQAARKALEEIKAILEGKA